MSFFENLSATQKKLSVISAIIISVGVIFSGIASATGIEIPRLATINDINENRILLSQNFHEDYERDIQNYQNQRLQVQQYKFQIQQQGQPVSPDVNNSINDYSEKIKSLKEEQKKIKNDIDQIKGG